MHALRLFPTRAGLPARTIRRRETQQQQERHRSDLARQLAALTREAALAEPMRAEQRRANADALATAQSAYDAARLRFATTAARLDADDNQTSATRAHLERQLKATADPRIAVALAHLTTIIGYAANATPVPTPAPIMLTYYEVERQLHALTLRADVDVRDAIDTILDAAGLEPLDVD